LKLLIPYIFGRSCLKIFPKSPQRENGNSFPTLTTIKNWEKEDPS
jgi:hypothetical protein